MKITADRDACVSPGMCVLTAPTVFDQDDDGIVIPLVDQVDSDDIETARHAVSLCPAQALTALEDQ